MSLDMLQQLVFGRMLSGGAAVDEEETAVAEEETKNKIFDIAIAIIFAREVLEGAVIVGNYRTVILRSEFMDEEQKAASLKAVTCAAWAAVVVAVLVVLAVAIPLGILSQDLDENVVMGIEGGSKLVAAICILLLSLKLPVWLNVFKKVSLCKKYDPSKGAKNLNHMSLKEIKFNVSWNIWRETAECGVFLIPFFLGSQALAIPLSAVVGIIISVILGFLIYYANNTMKNKTGLVVFMVGITLMLSVGLFVGGCHEFEEIFGETRKVYVIENPNLSHKKLPMALLKPFGYSSSRTVLQICSFWLWLGLGLTLLFLKWQKSQWVIATYGDQGGDEVFEAGDEQEKAKAVDEADGDDLEKVPANTQPTENNGSDESGSNKGSDKGMKEGTDEVQA